MRPATLREAVERIRAGEPRDMALPEFVDTFLLAADAGARLKTIDAEPPRSGDARLDALVAAMAEYLAKHYRLPRVPGWVGESWRRLDKPWFTVTSAGPAMHEYLTFSSPAEFRSRNIFTEERPLRRARSHLPYGDFKRSNAS
jgi:hypothetical protein